MPGIVVPCHRHRRRHPPHLSQRTRTHPHRVSPRSLPLFALPQTLRVPRNPLARTGRPQRGLALRARRVTDPCRRFGRGSHVLCAAVSRSLPSRPAGHGSAVPSPTASRGYRKLQCHISFLLSVSRPARQRSHRIWPVELSANRLNAYLHLENRLR